MIKAQTMKNEELYESFSEARDVGRERPVYARLGSLIAEYD